MAQLVKSCFVTPQRLGFNPQTHIVVVHTCNPSNGEEEKGGPWQDGSLQARVER